MSLDEVGMDDTPGGAAHLDQLHAEAMDNLRRAEGFCVFTVTRTEDGRPRFAGVIGGTPNVEGRAASARAMLGFLAYVHSLVEESMAAIHEAGRAES